MSLISFQSIETEFGPADPQTGRTLRQLIPHAGCHASPPSAGRKTRCRPPLRGRSMQQGTIERSKPGMKNAHFHGIATTATSEKAMRSTQCLPGMPLLRLIASVRAHVLPFAIAEVRATARDPHLNLHCLFSSSDILLKSRISQCGLKAQKSMISTSITTIDLKNYNIC